MQKTICIKFEGDWEEDLTVEELSNGLFKLLETPLLAEEDLSFGDLIQVASLADGSYRFIRVVTKSKCKSFTLVVGALSDSKKSRLWDFAVASGVNLEPTLEGVVNISIPTGTRKDFLTKFSAIIDEPDK